MKTIIITGATGNLGSVVTETFLQKGHKIIAIVADEASKRAFPEHENLETAIANLIDEAATTSFMQKMIETYTIDAALLLVGGFIMGNMADTKTEDIKNQIALNFETAYNVARPVFQHMLQNNYGRIVFIGARPALRANDGKNLIAYALSKSLLFKLAEFMNAEAKGKNVTTTVVVPSTIDTPVNRKSMPDANPDNWVKPQSLAEILQFVTSASADPLRETILKVYNNA